MSIVQFPKQKPVQASWISRGAKLAELAHSLSMSLLTSTGAIARADIAEELAAAIAEVHKHVSEAQMGWAGLVDATRHWR